jgi:hypothetical protein
MALRTPLHPSSTTPIHRTLAKTPEPPRCSHIDRQTTQRSLLASLASNKSAYNRKLIRLRSLPEVEGELSSIFKHDLSSYLRKKLKHLLVRRQ